ncbi:tRNA:m(4)X modification enzyme TRM13 homolog [Exaiptasia diaphana]|uniref:tRNA:m(4)X modification enzyme TRM13 n=1 Tax=Exaiptasia diaphana TaxID=2652724 RepID=A0A913X206_EXADI|nr:tRNA:m(4)X modification enzyme TRM13 homolog [Exaiptasia diaphana]KXJ16130.1 tRNA:m(4)X modification enzyme TRM13-like [Exaiptasia diaphana]
MADEVEKTATRTTCGFFMARKNRFCKMIVGKGKRYCGEHSHLGGEDKACGRTRIPCPLDPKHTVFEDQLQKHLKRCNVKKKTDVIYFEKNINSGLTDYKPTEGETTPLPDVSLQTVKELINRVKYIHQDNCPEIKESILSHSIFNDELSKSEYGTSALKHLKQQASLIGHLQKLDLLKSDTVYLEFGAGKGKLSHWIQQAIPNASNTEFVLIDRASNRHKFDSSHKRNDQGPDFKRLNLDIEHLNLGKVPLVGKSSKDITAVSKHLCGTATDLTLRCLFETLSDKVCNDNINSSKDSSDHDQSHSKRLKSSPDIKGIAIALCCHHQCYWPHYVGRPFLEGLGFTAVDFHLICCISSWATCGIRPPKSNPDVKENNEESQAKTENITGHVQSLGLSIAEREDIGRQCKRLLDLGRLWYLRTKGMSAKLCYYVDRSVSLENVVLLATEDRLREEDR